MKDTAILIQHLSKEYRLGVIGTGTLTHDLKRWWAVKTGKEDPTMRIGMENKLAEIGGEYVYALRDINLEIKQGEIVGIIGKNGAGKSTMLKILSRVTTPTSGTVDMYGRVASLLEVGTGFHPELTGRENIFLNGAIMGMSKAEIRSKFDEIVEFAGVGRYIDTPVKRYSSGMYVRLAFAVAAHLEPEILVVDEVLAVGDAEFQRKAIGKMQDVSKKEGRTVLFVSHNMAAVKSLCTQGIILANGAVRYEGEIENAVSIYLKGNNTIPNHKIWNNGSVEIKDDDFELLEVGVRQMNKDFNSIIRIDEPIEFIAKFRQKNSRKRIDMTLHLKDEQGSKVFSTSSSSIVDTYDTSEGIYVTSAVFPANFFNWGNFNIDLYVVENKKRALKVLNDKLSFTISNKEVELGAWMGKEPGAIMPRFEWQQQKLN
jgi:lipopolysaccharide transport system ATP-binding protein